ncbi:MAG: hypothetical protein R2715_13910 [Ilumatobacteraceae bacterium]
MSSSPQAGFVHPTIGRLAEPVPWHRTHSPLTRILMTVACLPVPAVLLAATQANSTGDRIVRTVGLVVLSVTIAGRVVDAIHTLTTPLTSTSSGTPSRTNSPGFRTAHCSGPG